MDPQNEVVKMIHFCYCFLFCSERLSNISNFGIYFICQSLFDWLSSFIYYQPYPQPKSHQICFNFAMLTECKSMLIHKKICFLILFHLFQKALVSLKNAYLCFPWVCFLEKFKIEIPGFAFSWPLSLCSNQRFLASTTSSFTISEKQTRSCRTL